MKTGRIWSPNRYRGWLLRHDPSGEFTATSPDFATIQIGPQHVCTRGQFVSAPDRMSLIGVIDRSVG